MPAKNGKALNKKIDSKRAAELYLSGASAEAIAAEFGCNPSSVQRDLRRQGVRMRRGGTVRMVPLEETAKRYLGGTTIPVLAEDYSVTRKAIYQALQRVGVWKPKRRVGPVLGGTTAAFLLLAGMSAARSHSFYEPACCSGTDCAPVEAGVVIENEKTGAVTVLGEVIGPRDARLRWSLDDRDHVCMSGLGGYGQPKIHCVYRRPKVN